MAEMTIRRFSVFSVAKIQGLLAFVIGLFIGVIYGARRHDFRRVHVEPRAAEIARPLVAPAQLSSD